MKTDTIARKAGTAFYRGPTWVEVDLDAIAHNVQQLRNHLEPHTEIMAVIKANAYGHGAVMIARTVLENGATRLAVHRVIEGLQLRQAGIDAPVLILGGSLPMEAKTIVSYDLTPTVISSEGASSLAKEAKSQRKIIPVHIKVDTGLGRFGLMPEEVIEFAKYLAQFDNLQLEGVYTHFATADEMDKTYTYYQFKLYQQVLDVLTKEDFSISLRHVANSAAALDLPEMHLDIVRCGIVIYGVYPSAQVNHSIPLRPALALKSRVVQVRTLPAGSSISYGRTYVTNRPITVALVPIGYGDGYHRLISNRGVVLVRGQRASILGRICMDQLVVDVSGIVGLKQNEEAVLIGRQGNDEIRVDEVAAWAETINYEVVANIAPRVARVYKKNGRVVAIDTLIGNFAVS